jgi:hypothetical protein
MMSCLMADFKRNRTNLVDVGMVRHMILNSIRANYVKYRKEYGELVIACDHTSNWRKEIFPYYKANRAKNRGESPFDWKAIYEAFDTVREELKENFPYRVIRVEGAEGDDIIGTLCEEFGTDVGLVIGEKILIISGDKDFGQLQKFDNVAQWDPVQKREIVVNDPTKQLCELIFRGDQGDGVPNILSDDNTLVMPDKRQGVISKKRVDSWNKSWDLGTFANGLDENIRRNFSRNQQLIDLSFTPLRLKDEILYEYDSQAKKPKKDLINYFMKNKLRNLIEATGDFV